jgi:hypothetical protein
LTEKWKHLKIVLPGEVSVLFYCALPAHIAGQSGNTVLLLALSLRLANVGLLNFKFRIPQSAVRIWNDRK